MGGGERLVGESANAGGSGEKEDDAVGAESGESPEREGGGEEEISLPRHRAADRTPQTLVP